MFRSVRVDERMGAIVWDNGADIDPDVLFYDLKPAWMETEQEVTRQGGERLGGCIGTIASARDRYRGQARIRVYPCSSVASET